MRPVRLKYSTCHIYSKVLHNHFVFWKDRRLAAQKYDSPAMGSRKEGGCRRINRLSPAHAVRFV